MFGRRASKLALAVLAAAAVACYAAENPKEDRAAPEAQAEPKVTVSADGTKVSDVLESLVAQSKEKIVAESSVKGSVTFAVNDVPLETALGAMCSASKLQWRRVYVKEESKILEQPDRLAAISRLVTGVGLPDVVVAESSTGTVAAHYVDPKAVARLAASLEQQEGMVRVYVVTNDSAAAAKAVEAEKSDAVQAYTDASKKLIDDFLKMTPEEQEQAIVAGITLYEQMDPSYMSSVMQALMNTDQDLLKRMVSRQTEMLFHMPEDQRRSMMRMNMEMMQHLTPEQVQILQEDARAVMEQMLH